MILMDSTWETGVRDIPFVINDRVKTQLQSNNSDMCMEFIVGMHFTK